MSPLQEINNDGRNVDLYIGLGSSHCLNGASEIFQNLINLGLTFITKLLKNEKNNWPGNVISCSILCTYMGQLSTPDP